MKPDACHPSTYEAPGCPARRAAAPARRAAGWVAALGAAWLLAGCSGPEPRAMLVTLPSLGVPPAAAAGPAAGPAAATAAAPALRWLAVRRLQLPEYLQARRVRYRADASTIAEWPHAFWAERLEVAASREFAAALAGQLPGWQVCEGVCTARPADAVLLVEFAPLDFRRDSGRLAGMARLTVTTGDAQARVLQAWQDTLDAPAPREGPQGQAEALGAALQRLAERTARRLATLP